MPAQAGIHAKWYLPRACVDLRLRGDDATTPWKANGKAGASATSSLIGCWFTRPPTPRCSSPAPAPTLICSTG